MIFYLSLVLIHEISLLFYVSLSAVAGVYSMHCKANISDWNWYRSINRSDAFITPTAYVKMSLQRSRHSVILIRTTLNSTI